MITNSFQTEKLLEMRIRYLVTSSFLNDDNKANAMVKDVRSALQDVARLVTNLFVASVRLYFVGLREEELIENYQADHCIHI